VVTGGVYILPDNGDIAIDVGQAIQVRTTGRRRQHVFPLHVAAGQIDRDQPAVIETRNDGLSGLHR
jgi:hypothetical protein